MAGADLVIQAILELKSKIQGGKSAETQLNKVDKAAKKAKKSLTKAEQAAKKLSNTLVGFVGGAVLLRFVSQSIEAFANWERQLKTTAAEAERMGLSVSGTVQRVTELTVGLEKQTGVLRTETLPVFNKFLGLTGDVEQAALLTRAAVGAAEGGFKDLATAGNLLGSILQGEVIEPSKSLGLAFDQAKTSAEQQSVILEQAIDKMLGMSKGIDDVRGASDQLAAAWNELKIAVGQGLGPAVIWLSGALKNTVTVIKSLGPIALKTFLQLKGGIIGAAKSFGTFMSSIRTLNFKNLGERISDSFAEGMKTVERDIRFAEESLDELWAGSAADRIQTSEAEAAAKQKLLDTANTRQAALEAKANEKQAEIDARAAVAVADLNQANEDALLAVKIAATEQGTKARLDLELEMLDRLRERAVAEAKERGADVALVEMIFRQSRLARIRQHNKDRIKEEKKFKKDFLKVLKEAAKEEVAINDAAAELMVQTRRDQQDGAIAIANLGVALGREAFGESKALAAAQVVVDTAAAVMNIQRAWAYLPVVAGALMAFTIGLGIVQLRNIANAEPGSASISGGGGLGGPSPENIHDFAPDDTKVDATPGLLPDTAPETSINGAETGGLTVNFHGPNVIDDASMRRFMRKARRAERRDKSHLQ